MALRIPCYCGRLRQAARVVTQHYDHALRPVKLTVTQFTLLMVLDELDGARINELVKALAMDQTTLSRTLALMKRNRLLKRESGKDRRETIWKVTAAGKQKYGKAAPRWRAVQNKIESLLGAGKASTLKAIATQLTESLAK